MTDPADKDAEIDFRAVGFTADAAQFPRPPLAVAMLAAFNNVTADQRYFPNDHMMRAWERVADTARLTIIAEFEAEIERTIKRNADLDAEIAALRAEVAELRAAIFGGTHYAPELKAGNFAEMAKATEAGRLGAIARAEAAEARVKELEAGLLPFADVLHEYDGSERIDMACRLDDELVTATLELTFGDFRRAAALLSPKDKTNDR